MGIKEKKLIVHPSTSLWFLLFYSPNKSSLNVKISKMANWALSSVGTRWAPMSIVMLISTKLKSKHTPSNDGAHDEHGSSLTFPNHHGACSQDCWQGSKTQITTSNETLL